MTDTVSGMGRRVVVEHRGYGCETGCAGHVVLVDGEEVGDFEFGGPGYLRGGQLVSESHREYAERIVREQAGDDHIADLDWESCVIVDD